MAILSQILQADIVIAHKVLRFALWNTKQLVPPKETAGIPGNQKLQPPHFPYTGAAGAPTSKKCSAPIRNAVFHTADYFTENEAKFL